MKNIENLHNAYYAFIKQLIYIIIYIRMFVFSFNNKSSIVYFSRIKIYTFKLHMHITMDFFFQHGVTI